MPIALLGPLRIGEDGNSVSPRDRAVLIALALRPGVVVSAESLADAIWDGAAPPKSWAKVVQGSVMRLRRRLGTSAIETTSAGYRLTLGDDELDVAAFEHLLDRAASLAAAGEHERAVIAWDRALALWRGEPFGDLHDWPPAHAEAVRLDELRQAAEEDRLSCLVSAGGPERLVGQARALVSAQPLREHRWALLARALYATGRQGEALMAIQQAKRVLREELGLDASPELAALETAILRQDPGLLTQGDRAAVASQRTCPYRGLRPFTADEAEWFFGRDGEIEACLARSAEARLVLVVGPSGSGKSSLVRAGVMPRLQARGLRALVLTPGPDPLGALTAACADLDESAVLVVDQLEEVFLAQGGTQATAFLDALAAQVAGGTTAFAALRGDHVVDVGCSSPFAQLAERGLHLVPGLDEAGLRAAIEEPARRAGLRLEPGLVDLLVRDSLGEPGGLPLLSHALVETWERREGRTLTVDGYQAAGGIRGAVAQSAERLYGSLARADRATVRAMLLRLVASTPDGGPTSTRVPLTVLRSDAEHERLLDLLVHARLVTTDDATVSVAHESLGRAWPRLRDWLDEDLEGQRLLRHLASTAVEWEALGRPDSELYRGSRLASAREWLERGRCDLTPVEREFVTASQAAVDQEERTTAARLRRERRQNRRLRWLLVATAVALVVALVAGLLAWTQQHEAEASALEADARRLGAQAATELSLDRALLLAAQGVRLHDDADTRRNLLEAVTGSPEAVQILTIDGRQLFDVEISPDGRLVAVGDDTGTVTIAETATADLVAPPFRLQGDAPGYSSGHLLSFSPDSRRLLVGFSGLSLLTLSGDSVATELLAPADSRIEDGDPDARYGDAVWAPDGSTVTVLHGRDGVSVWDVVTMQRLRQGQPFGPPWTGGAKLVDQDRVLLHSWTEPSVVADAMTATPLHALGAATWPYAITADATQLVSADRDVVGGLMLIDPGSGAVLTRVRAAEAGVTSLAFSADGTSVVAGTTDRLVTLLEGGTLAVRGRLAGHGGIVQGVAHQSPDLMWSVANDGRAIQWDVGSGGDVGDVGPASRTVTSDLGALSSGRVSPDGRVVAYSTYDGALRAYDVVRQAPLWDLGDELLSGAASTTDFSADGRVFAAVDGSGTVVVVDVDEGQDRPAITVPPGSEGLALSGDGSRIVVGTPQGVSMWDTESGRQLATTPTPGAVFDLVSDADQWVYAVTLAPSLVAFDADTLQPRVSVALDTSPFSVAVSPDHRTVAVGARDATIRFFDTTSLRQVQSVVVDDPVGELAWDHAGAHFVSVGESGQFILWDGTDRTTLMKASLDPGFLGYAEFTADDETLVTLSRSGRVVEWIPSDASLVERACAVAGRDLTREEWAQYLPDRPYERTCSAD